MTPSQYQSQYVELTLLILLIYENIFQMLLCLKTSCSIKKVSIGGEITQIQNFKGCSSIVILKTESRKFILIASYQCLIDGRKKIDFMAQLYLFCTDIYVCQGLYLQKLKTYICILVQVRKLNWELTENS